MTYQPQDLEGLVPPIATVSVPDSPYHLCVDNHVELYSLAELPVASWCGEPLQCDPGVERAVLRFRSARGYDHQLTVSGAGIRLRVEVIARATTAGAGGDLKLSGGLATVTTPVAGTGPLVYTLTAYPDSDHDEWTLALAPAAGKVLEIQSIVAYWVSATPTARAFPSQWRLTVASQRQTNAPVHTELAARLLNGPVLIARDRPACVFSHLFPMNSTGGAFAKYGRWSAFGIVDNVEPAIVGRGRIPAADVRPRPYLVEYYLRSSNGTAGALRVGGAEYPVTANAWGSFQVDVAPADVDLVAKIEACGLGDYAYYETIQVWRMSP